MSDTLTMSKQAVFDFIASRRSIGKLTTPAPSTEEINQAIALAMTAPDHKQLTPWRFVVLVSEETKAAFGQALLEAAQEDASIQGEVLGEADVAKFLAMPNRAPVIIGCIISYKYHDKVPKSEQVLSMGASVQNLLLGLLAQGYQSIWRSGALMNHAVIQRFFQLAQDEELAGFVYVGSSEVVMPKRDTVELSAYVTYR